MALVSKSIVVMETEGVIESFQKGTLLQQSTRQVFSVNV